MLDSCWAHVGLIWTCSGLIWAHAGLVLDSCWAHVGLMLGSLCWAHAGLIQATHRLPAAPAAPRRSVSSRRQKLCPPAGRLTSPLICLQAHVGVIWAHAGAHVGLIWAHAGLMLNSPSSCWAHVELTGLMLGSCWTHLGSCWAHAGLIWAHAGLMLDCYVGLMLGSCWAHVGLVGLMLGSSCRLVHLPARQPAEARPPILIWAHAGLTLGSCVWNSCRLMLGSCGTHAGAEARPLSSIALPRPL